MGNKNCLKYCIVVFVIFILTQSAFSQDSGIRDSLFVTGVSFWLKPNTHFEVVASGYHDEKLNGIVVPLTYKVAQIDIILDSVRFHPDMDSANLRDTSINRTKGEVMFYAFYYRAKLGLIHLYGFGHLYPAFRTRVSLRRHIRVWSGSLLCFTRYKLLSFRSFNYPIDIN